jgi:hypothetical protein
MSGSPLVNGVSIEVPQVIKVSDSACHVILTT